MKKVLSIALALVMILILSVTAFAEDHNVNAKYIPDMSISTTVTWGEMYFTYTQASSTWTATDSSGTETTDANKVTVRNDSLNASIDVSAIYADYDSDSISSAAFAPYIFSSQTTTFASTDDLSGAYTASNSVTLGSDVSPSGVAQGWLMFTDGTGAASLSVADFQQVGTLTLTITQH